MYYQQTNQRYRRCRLRGDNQARPQITGSTTQGIEKGNKVELVCIRFGHQSRRYLIRKGLHAIRIEES